MAKSLAGFAGGLPDRMIQRSGAANPWLIGSPMERAKGVGRLSGARFGRPAKPGHPGAKVGVGREELREFSLWVIECAGQGTALARFGRTVAVRPSILWWLRLPALFAANNSWS